MRINAAFVRLDTHLGIARLGVVYGGGEKRVTAVILANQIRAIEVTDTNIIVNEKFHEERCSCESGHSTMIWVTGAVGMDSGEVATVYLQVGTAN